MEPDEGARTFGSVLAAAEAASPVDAVEAVTRELGLALGATKVSFLIADLSGRALVRLAHVRLRTAEGVDIGTPVAPGERRAVEESATVMPFDGGPAELAVRTQEVQVVAPDRELGVRRRRIVAGAGPGDGTRGGHRPPGADPPRPTGHRSPSVRSRSWRTCWRSW